RDTEPEVTEPVDTGQGGDGIDIDVVAGGISMQLEPFDSYLTDDSIVVLWVDSEGADPDSPQLTAIAQGTAVRHHGQDRLGVAGRTVVEFNAVGLELGREPEPEPEPPGDDMTGPGGRTNIELSIDATLDDFGVEDEDDVAGNIDDRLLERRQPLNENTVVTLT